MECLNLILFVCEALGYQKNIYTDIDRLYQHKGSICYELAIKHEFYTHSIITEGSLIYEEYSKKALGIILYMMENISDKEFSAMFCKMIEKGFPYADHYVNQHRKISFDKFCRSFINKNKGIKNITDDKFNCELAVLLLLSVNSGKEIDVKD
jgi:hypothetical protein